MSVKLTLRKKMVKKKPNHTIICVFCVIKLGVSFQDRPSYHMLTYAFAFCLFGIAWPLFLRFATLTDHGLASQRSYSYNIVV